MTTVLFWLAVGILVLVVLALIPGIRYLVKPVIESIWKLVHFCAEHMGAWVIWVIKTILRSHFVFIDHLAHDENVLDPTAKIRAKKNLDK